MKRRRPIRFVYCAHCGRRVIVTATVYLADARYCKSHLQPDAGSVLPRRSWQPDMSP